MIVKKLALLIAAVATLGVAVPAMANADPVITVSAGVLMPAGTKVTITGKSIGITSSTLGGINCNVLNAQGKLETNNSSEGFSLKGNGEFTFAECSNPNGPVKITSVSINYLRATGMPTATAAQLSVKITADVGATLCTFEAPEAAPLTGTFTPGTNKIVFSNASGLKGGACGTAKLNATFLFDADGYSTTPIFDE